MQGSVWINMLRRIPADLHNTLTLGLVTGGEVVVQQLIKMESEFVIIRGRMSGTTAEGRVMVVPYSHLAMVAINKRIAEPEVQSIFGIVPQAGVVAATSASSAAVEAAPDVSMPAGPSPAPVPATPPPQPPNPLAPKPAATAGSSNPPSKSILLAKLRERLAEKAK